jgi:N,N'-diacetyllegionaminate synthase
MKSIFIAEAGVNHNGKLKNAKKLIDAASAAGADYVKFQWYKTDNLIKKKTETAKYQKKNYGVEISQYDLLKKYELGYGDFKKLIVYSKKKKIRFLCSVFDEESFENLIKLKVFEVKIPSGEINNIPLLQKITKKAKRVFISCGMSNLKEISFALNLLKKNKKLYKNLYLLHCHTDYPTKLEDVNLRAMNYLRNKFKIQVGYSDHTSCSKTGMAAIAMEAKVIEKHFTLSKNLQGPDHKASLEPKKLKSFIKDLRDVEKLLGSEKKKISSSEKLNKRFVRKSIIAKKIIKKGERFTKENLICKRPEGGLSPNLWFKVIGKKAKKNFDKDQNISI